MSTFSKRMKLKADCFDPNVEIRDLARVAYAELIFESFEGKDQDYITDRELNDVLFLCAGNTETVLLLDENKVPSLSSDILGLLR